MRAVPLLVLFALLYFGYRRAASKLAKAAVGCSALLVPAAIYNLLYGWLSWSHSLPIHVVVFAIMGGVGLILSPLLEGIALIRDGMTEE